MHIAAFPHGEGFESVVAAIASKLATIELAYDARRRLVTATLRFPNRPCFTLRHLEDFSALHAGLVEAMSGTEPEERPVRFLLYVSGEPGFWSLGGDLDLFARCIRDGDRDTLRRYAYECVDSGYQSHMGLGLSLVTICLVQGQALGGGFESARSCNLLFAEEQSGFGLPEINFSMFPGMGAYAYIADRIGMHRVEELILTSAVRSAPVMHEMGAVDFVVPQGDGIKGVHAFVDRYGKRFSGLSAMMDARRISMGVDLARLRGVVDLWVDCAFRIKPSDLKMMQRLVGAQGRIRSRHPTLEVA